VTPRQSYISCVEYSAGEPMCSDALFGGRHYLQPSTSSLRFRIDFAFGAGEPQLPGIYFAALQRKKPADAAAAAADGSSSSSSSSSSGGGGGSGGGRGGGSSSSSSSNSKPAAKGKAAAMQPPRFVLLTELQ
jgi:hypothetical protein